MRFMKMGRPTKYQKEFAEQARKLCLLGHTDKELAKFFEVHESTIHQWKHDFPEFSESINLGKSIADADVAEKLYHRAVGYSHPEVKVFCNEGVVTEHEVTKHYAPDVTAIAIWLKNRQKHLWNDKKATAPTINFTIDEKGKPTEQAAQILAAIAAGIIQPDIGAMLISSISNVLKIEEVTTIKEEMEEIKRKLGLDV